VLANRVLLSPCGGVSAVGVPVKAGDASGAKVPNADVTNAVDAALVLLLSGASVGIVTTPVNVGLANGASVLMILKSALRVAENVVSPDHPLG
jgi:hypothetical protein